MHIILYILDALRVDHLGCYGYKRETSPCIDALAADGVVFENCFTSATWTRPAAASILTGTYPSVHQACFRDDMFLTPLLRLPEVLRAGGFKAAAFSTMGNIAGNMGFERGFDRYVELFRDPRVLAKRRKLDPSHEGLMNFTGEEIALPRAEDINEHLLHWLEENRENNTFSFIWSIETHAPYDAPEDFRRFSSGPEGVSKRVDRDALRGSGAGDRQSLIDLYDDEIFYNDHCLGEIVRHLKKLGTYEDSMIILAGDHGDAFYEHQLYGHGHAPYDELIHVPLVMKFPQGRLQGQRESALAELIDIFPTVVAAAGISFEKRENACMQGHNLISLLQNASDFKRDYVFSDTQPTELQNRYFSVRSVSWKYIYVERPKRNPRTLMKTLRHVIKRRMLLELLRYPAHFLRGYFHTANEYLFNLEMDTEEKNSLVRERPDIAIKYKEVLTAWQARNKEILAKAGSRLQEYKEDEQLRKHLENLGYM